MKLIVAVCCARSPRVRYFLRAIAGGVIHCHAGPSTSGSNPGDEIDDVAMTNSLVNRP